LAKSGSKGTDGFESLATVDEEGKIAQRGPEDICYIYLVLLVTDK